MYSLEYLKAKFLEHPKVGRATRLAPKEIGIVLGVDETTIGKDRKSGLISPNSDAERIPHYEPGEIHAWMVRKGMIEV